MRMGAMQMTNLVLTILFTLEMVVKHVALGLLGYWSSGFNVLDGVIVVASLVDLCLQYSGGTGTLGKQLCVRTKPCGLPSL